MKISNSSVKRTFNKAILTEIFGSIILIFFVHTIISSYRQLTNLQELLSFYTMKTVAVSWAIILFELAAVILLFFPRTRIIGFVLTIAFALTGIFVIYKTPHLPHDFGGIVNLFNSKQQYSLYAILLGLSVTGIVLACKRRPDKKGTALPTAVYT